MYLTMDRLATFFRFDGCALRLVLLAWPPGACAQAAAHLQSQTALPPTISNLRSPPGYPGIAQRCPPVHPAATPLWFLYSWESSPCASPGSRTLRTSSRWRRSRRSPTSSTPRAPPTGRRGSRPWCAPHTMNPTNSKPHTSNPTPRTPNPTSYTLHPVLRCDDIRATDFACTVVIHSALWSWWYQQTILLVVSYRE